MKSVVRAIQALGNEPFTTRDLRRILPNDTRGSIDMALSRLVSAGYIRRLRRGVFDQPRHQDRLGELPPDPKSIATAIARAEGVRLIPSGNLAANVLGLSKQVPARLIYRTTGPSRKIKVGKATVELRHSDSGRLRTLDDHSATVLEALRALGKNGISAKTIATLRRMLDEGQRFALDRATAEAPSWMQPHLRKITRK